MFFVNIESHRGKFDDDGMSECLMNSLSGKRPEIGKEVGDETMRRCKEYLLIADKKLFIYLNHIVEEASQLTWNIKVMDDIEKSFTLLFYTEFVICFKPFQSFNFCYEPFVNTKVCTFRKVVFLLRTMMHDTEMRLGLLTDILSLPYQINSCTVDPI